VKRLTDHSKYTIACVDSVIEPSSDRVVPPCPEVDHGCGACQWQHISIPMQRELKGQIIIEAIERSGVQCPEPKPPIELAPWGFRTTINAAVKDGRAGFHRSRSHQIVAVDSCLVAHPSFRIFSSAVGIRVPKRSFSDVELGPGNAWRRPLRQGSLSGCRAMSVRNTFMRRRPDDRGESPHDRSSRLGPTAWTRWHRQSWMRRAKWAPSTALDLYSGVGLFAGVLAERGWSVTAVEGSSSSVADAEFNLRDLKVTVVRADVTTWTPHQADLVVADPSRFGLGREGVDVVAATNARRVILISCDAASLGRDASLLRHAGYTLNAVTHVDLFPQTYRVEAVTVYDR